MTTPTTSPLAAQLPPHISSSPSSLREAQTLFLYLSSIFVKWAFEVGYTLTETEGCMMQTRYGVLPYAPAVRQKFTDRVHMDDSLHYLGLAKDFNLFVMDPETGRLAYVTVATAAEWQVLGQKWKELHPLCRWGGDFTGKSAGDVNHFSIEWEGRA